MHAWYSHTTRLQALGFIDCRVVSPDGDIIATGSHLKYMPMGMYDDVDIGQFPAAFIDLSSSRCRPTRAA